MKKKLNFRLKSIIFLFALENKNQLEIAIGVKCKVKQVVLPYQLMVGWPNYVLKKQIGKWNLLLKIGAVKESRHLYDKATNSNINTFE